MTRSAPRPSPGASTPRTIAAGTPSVLPSTSSAAAAISSATAICVVLQLVARRVAAPAQVAERGDPGDAERYIGRSLAPRTPERIADDDPDVNSGQVAQAFAEPAGRGVRIEREQHECARAGGVGGIDACARTDEAVPRLGDQKRRPRADDTDAFTKDRLDLGRVAVRTGQLVRPPGGLDLLEADDPALDLGDRLLSDHDDVPGEQTSCGSCRLGYQGREIVALAQLGDPLQPEDANLAAHGRPVSLTPACAL